MQGLDFLRLGVTNPYVRGLNFLRLPGVINPYVRGLDFLRFVVRFLTFRVRFFTFWG